ncbi:MmcQ/YjbR family DNA-binding protein [Neoroseomonas nitratireducens]|uniref:MmcQ/YjbR family DNA-binding protein n=1 Tax=Roseomonas nitratireducens TaxID=2820810 RepID=UPI0031595CEF
MNLRALARLRAICLALPDAAERETWGIATWRIRDRIFCMWSTTDRLQAAMWCKAPPGSQEVLVAAAPDRFFVPPYVGHKGWIGVVLDGDADWEEVAALVRRSWRMTAPKRLAATLPD